MPTVPMMDDPLPPFPRAFWAWRQAPTATALNDWLDAHLAAVHVALRASGAVLFRGFGVTSPDALREIAERITGPLGEHYEGPSPRKGVARGVYTASEAPSVVPIPAHAEMSYLERMPRHLYFLCREPSRVGGETTLADGRKVLARLDPELVGPLFEQPLRIRRRHAGPSRVPNPFAPTPWTSMFATEDRDEALERARALGFDARFEPDGSLTLEHEQPVARRHPETGELAWLNHLLVFHASTPAAILEGALRARRAPVRVAAAACARLAAWAGREVASDVRLANGDPIPDATVDHVRRVVARSSVALGWKRGDLVIVDNHRVLHGRLPFRGKREVLVAWSAARA